MDGVVVGGKRRAEVGDGLVDETESVLRLAEAVPGPRLPGLERDRFLTGFERRGAESEASEVAGLAESLGAPDALGTMTGLDMNAWVGRQAGREPAPARGSRRAATPTSDQVVL
jgi:hypothetical protein